MTAARGGWQVDDWRSSTGARPVQRFIDRLSKPARAKVYASLEMLEEHGNDLQLPHSRALGSGLYELRIAHQEGPFRVIYCYRGERRILLLHAFVKRSEAIRQQDLEVANARKPTR